MGTPTIAKKADKKEKKFLYGKVEKTKEKFNKGSEEAPIKLNKGKKEKKDKKAKKLAKLIQEENATTDSPPDADFSANSTEKKDKVKKGKKAKDLNEVTEADTDVSSGKKDKKKKSKKNKEAGTEETAGTDGVSQPQRGKKDKKNTVLTKEQEQKIQAKRDDKVQKWHEAIDLLLKKKFPKEEVELIKKSKHCPKLPLWKKNYIIWVKTDPKYQEKKIDPLIKKVYKVLKRAEHNIKKNKKKNRQQSAPRTTPQAPKTQAAIDRCVQMSQGADSSGENEKEAKETLLNEMAARHGKAGKNKVFKQNEKALMNKEIVKQEYSKRMAKDKSVFKQKKEKKKFIENTVGKKNKKFMKKTKQ